MGSILTPGYVKWDGFKYVLDPTLQGPPGPAGPAGPQGPAGPAGPGGSGNIISAAVTITVDPVNGNDANPFPGPWKTIAKLNSYLTGAIVENVRVGINVLSSPSPSSDEHFAPQNVLFKGQSAIIIVTGPITVVHTGTLTASTTAINPSTQTRNTVDDTVLGSWASYVHMRVTDLSQTEPTVSPAPINGGHLGAWLVHSSGTTCDTSQTFFPGNDGNLTGSAVTQSPYASPWSPSPFWSGGVQFASGDSYQIEQRVTLYVDKPTGTSTYGNNIAMFQFVDLNLNGSLDFSGASIYALRCYIQGNFTFAELTPYLTDCLLNGWFTYDLGNSVSMEGGALIGSFTQGSVLLTGYNEYITGSGLTIGYNSAPDAGPGAWLNMLTNGWVQVQDCTGTGIGACIYLSEWSKMWAAYSIFWGTNNTAPTLGLDVGSQALINQWKVQNSSGQDWLFFDQFSNSLTTSYRWNKASGTFGPTYSNTWFELSYVNALNGTAFSPGTGAYLLYAGTINLG